MASGSNSCRCGSPWYHRRLCHRRHRRRRGSNGRKSATPHGDWKVNPVIFKVTSSEAGYNAPRRMRSGSSNSTRAKWHEREHNSTVFCEGLEESRWKLDRAGAGVDMDLHPLHRIGRTRFCMPPSPGVRCRCDISIVCFLWFYCSSVFYCPLFLLLIILCMTFSLCCVSRL